MRMLYVTAPIGAALALAGGYLILQANQIGDAPLVAMGLNTNQPKHPVTEAMLADTLAMAKADAPAFERKDHRGRDVKVGGATGKPQLILFIKSDCPCNVDAQPFYNRLYKRFEGKVDFVGVIDGDEKAARQWVLDNNCRFPVAADPAQEIMKAYVAKHSVYTALVTPAGKIVKMYPGYWDKMLIEMNARLEVLAGLPPEPFDPEYAPTKPSSGCAFAL